MSTAPPTLRALQAFLRTQTGLHAASLGIVGDKKHRKGYHLGRDRIFGPSGQGHDDYSVKTARDRSGLDDSASAIDIGNFKRLREMSKWIVAQARSDAPDTRDIREIIYSPDGKKVLRWDRERGVNSRPRTGEADDSHRTHTHVSWYRDSESRDKVALYERFFDDTVAATPGIAAQPPAHGASGGIVKSFSVPTVASICTVPKGVQLFESSDLKKVAFNIDPGRDMPFLGEPFKGIGLVHRTDEQGRPTGRAFFASMSDLKDIRPAAPGA
jgi:hypothetical protein